MKVLVTGGHRGLGKYLADLFQADVVSRTDGYDITTDEKKIANLSLEYDVFVNNAFDGPPHEVWANYGQVNVLQEVYLAWALTHKRGHIINIGSVGEKNIVAPFPAFETYRVAKAALSHASRQCTAAFKHGIVPFKTTLITLDRMDTDLSRSRENWTGNGIDLGDVANILQMVLDIRSNTCIEEVVAYVNFSYKS